MLLLLFAGAFAIPRQSYAAEQSVGTWDALLNAFQNAPSGDTIVLSNDITQNSGTLYERLNVSLTLNLNGHTLSVTAPSDNIGPGVGVYATSSLTIEDTVGGGILNATGSPGGYGAGIGSGNEETAGTIIIAGGTINAVGGSSGAAGIGGGFLGNGGTVIINGGTVNATGNSGAAGIGGGLQGAGGSVTINGGTINATGNNGGTGIGGGYEGGGAAVVITGGTVIPSTGNTPGFSAIGASSLSNNGTIVLTSGQQLIIPSGVIFENSGTIEGDGSLSGGGSIHNTGTINSGVSGITVNGNAYDLSFDLNGAPGTPPSSLHVLASTVREAGLSLTSPAPPGYEFVGWYTSDGVPFTDTTPISSITSTSSVTLYAHWKELEIVSVVPLSDIHVAYGTVKSGISLPGAVNVTLNSGETKPAAVTWDEGTPAYDGTKPGTYAFVGAITPPAGSSNPDGKTANVNVIVDQATVISVSPLSDIHVPYGTALNDIGLPTTVDVTLNSGATEQAAVAWNGGNPAYNGTVPGTYAFTGTLTAPEGATNPDGKTASVNVIVEQPTVTAVSSLLDIHVPYGTALIDVGLPTAVEVTLSSGDTEQAAVAWNGGNPAYNGTQPGTYAFTGTLTAPAGATNPDGKTASVNVIVEQPTVTAVSSLLDIQVSYGTALNDIGLPTTVDVMLSNGATEQAAVTWNGGAPAYNGTVPGTYAFTGTLTAPAGATNPDGKTASVNVIVEQPTVTTVSPLSDIYVLYGTALNDIGLPTTVDVTLSNGATEQAAVTWNGGAPAYNGTQPGTYAFTGILTAPAGSDEPGWQDGECECDRRAADGDGGKLAIGHSRSVWHGACRRRSADNGRRDAEQWRYGASSGNIMGRRHTGL